MEDKMLETALKYAEKGWHVFPVTREKVPFANTRGYKDGTTDPDQVKNLWERFPHANIAIATGKKSGLFVLDVDVKNYKVGEDSLKALEDKHGELPETVECLTASGGRHLYFKYPDCGVEIKNSQGKVGQDLDIRAQGGYVVAPPSVIDEKAYHWELTFNPDELEIASAPKWLMDIASQKTLAKGSCKTSSSSPSQTIDLSLTGEKIKEGKRNETLMLMGVKLRKSGLDQQQIEDNLLKINEARCVPPLDKAEIANISQSVSKYEKNNTSESSGQTSGLTDMWNAERLFKLYGQDMTYCFSLGGWFLWNGKYWEKDEDLGILRLVSQTIKGLYREASEQEDKVLYKHAVRSESEPRLNAVVRIARSLEGVVRKADQFDRDNFLLNLSNGTLNLKTGVLQEHKRSDFLTKQLEVSYKGQARCPEWGKFLDRIFQGNTELIRFMKKVVGYCLSGSVSEQCLFIFYGSGSNGKSTFLKHIFQLLGAYAVNMPSSTLLVKKMDSIPNDIARLKGRRFVTSSESGKMKALDESLMKQLTGDDAISARFLHKEYFDFFSTFKIFLATNYKPQISGMDDGIWRRIVMIPFEHSVSNSERDSDLDVKLKQEYEGILRWAVEGFQLWQKEGLKPPEELQDQVSKYKEEFDVIANYIEDRCVIKSLCSVQSSVIIKDFRQWSYDNGYGTMSRQELINSLKRRGFEKRMKTAGRNKGSMYWYGIGLKGEEYENVPF